MTNTAGTSPGANGTCPDGSGQPTARATAVNAGFSGVTDPAATATAVSNVGSGHPAPTISHPRSHTTACRTLNNSTPRSGHCSTLRIYTKDGARSGRVQAPRLTASTRPGTASHSREAATPEPPKPHGPEAHEPSTPEPTPSAHHADRRTRRTTHAPAPAQRPSPPSAAEAAEPPGTHTL